MKLEDIKINSVVWNQWDYSIMGRDTGTNDSYFLIISVGNITTTTHDNKKIREIKCEVKEIESGDLKKWHFTDEDIEKGNLKFASKIEIKRLQTKAKGNIEKSIVDHKTKIDALNLELEDIENKYSDFIKNSI